MSKRKCEDRLKTVSKKMKILQDTLLSLQENLRFDSSGSNSDDSNNEESSPYQRRKKFRKIIVSSSSSDEEQEGGSLRTVTAEVHDRSSSVNVSKECLLGIDPKKLSNYGPRLDDDLVSRWQTFLIEGIDKEAREEFSKILFPENCPELAAPVINTEAEKLLSALDKKKDSMFSTIQDKLGRGLTKLGETISLILASETISDNDKALLIPKAADSAKMFCEVHYLLSNHRKHQVYPYMTQATQKLAEESKRDVTLFGSDFSEKCKAANAAEKTATDIKAKKPTFAGRQKLRSSSFYLNSQRQAPKFKMKTSNAFKNHRKEDRPRKTRPRAYQQYQHQEYFRQRR
ncbi:unnamed protein product [Callosobruchus maculatus]|uniref:Uncharacterized protein n=1 Tax=Callosobruchus maculatus TaxID=64391 RepID=A0A653BML5_CALMS|nr:unnamed protein product [Callosobruchus maculatus]